LWSNSKANIKDEINIRKYKFKIMKINKKNNKKKILNHIQFLRGISVILVFFYHLNLRYFDYGFLGVDIFFVISGFVITSIISNEIKKTKIFDFYNFYTRRFKRIYPALFFVLTISFFLIIFLQPLDLFLDNLKVYFLSLFGVSNFYYLFLKKDYFDTVFNDPFAHTWSLGVEEQFYIIFPLLLFFILKYEKYLKSILILSLLVFIGIVFSNIFVENIKLIFYSPFFRFWEFLIGTLTFFLTKKIKIKNNHLSLSALFVLFLFILIPKNINLPNTILITCILTSLFILFYKKNKKKLSNYIIENKPMLFLGNVSYSFYLWHLPVIYFYDLYFLQSLFRVPLLFLIIISLSFLSFRIIENKLRYSKFNIRLNFRNITFCTILLFIILIINIVAFRDSYNSAIKYKFKNLIYNLNYLENKINYTDRVVFYKINIDGNEIYRFCSESSEIKKLNSYNLRINCLKKGITNNRIFYIEGNSHTANFIPMFNEININDSVYYNHKANLFEKDNFSYDLINNLQKIIMKLCMLQIYLTKNLYTNWLKFKKILKKKLKF
jgi:peptidoglycan/LPS O-acetylase OafA/YrhL